MRQAGILAAAGVYALQHNIERLAEDHRRAEQLAETIAELPNIALLRVATNMVFARAEADAPDNWWQRLSSLGVKTNPPDAAGRWRLVLHKDVDDAALSRAREALALVFGS
jgi:threonine aldolase